MDKVLADLEQASIIIAGAKSQFYHARLKIIGYICNANGYHLDTSKILKILNWLDCTNVTFAHVFIEVCIY